MRSSTARTKADNDSVKSNGNLVNQNTMAHEAETLGPNRRHFNPVDVVGKSSIFWNYYMVYPENAKASTLAVCKACYAKHIVDDGIHSSKWEIKIGKSLSTSKLQQHLKR